MTKIKLHDYLLYFPDVITTLLHACEKQLKLLQTCTFEEKKKCP